MSRNNLISRLAAVASAALLAAMFWAGVCAVRAGAQETSEGGGMGGFEARGRVRAPELAGGRGWLNTDKPLSLAALRGKVVLLDFWTFCCINCLHVVGNLLS